MDCVYNTFALELHPDTVCACPWEGQVELANATSTLTRRAIHYLLRPIGLAFAPLMARRPLPEGEAFSERNPQPELNLPWVGGVCGFAESWKGSGSRPKRVVGKLEVRPVERVETFGEHLDLEVFLEVEPAAQPKIE